MARPLIVTLRPGVAFSPDAAASWQRCEADLGRRIQTNSTYRDYDQQLAMYRAWQRYINGGPRPPHSMALHPDRSKHCLGLAADSDEWVSSSFNTFMAERGWIRTAASDPTERHHYEYQSWRDKHLNRPASGGSTPIEGDEMSLTPTQAAQLAELWEQNTVGREGVKHIGAVARMTAASDANAGAALAEAKRAADLIESLVVDFRQGQEGSHYAGRLYLMLANASGGAAPVDVEALSGALAQKLNVQAIDPETVKTALREVLSELTLKAVQ